MARRRKPAGYVEQRVGRVGKWILMSVGITIVLCAIGYLFLPDRPSIHDGDSTTPAVPSLSRVADIHDGYFRHLRSRGVAASDYIGDEHGPWAWSDLDTFDLASAGDLVCDMMEGGDGDAFGRTLAELDSITNNPLASALIADAAIDHLCIGVDK